MKQFNALVCDILINGRWSGNRTGDPTKKVFGRQLRFNLAEGFPLVTGRKIYMKGVIVELLWFIQGLFNSQDLEKQNVNIWRQWALRESDLDLTAHVKNSKAKIWRRRKVEAIATNEDLAFKSYNQLADKYGIPHPTYRELGYVVGDLGPVYGKQWVDWLCADGRVINQLKEVEHLLRTKPNSRRIIVSAWNPADLPDESVSPQQNVLDGKMALAACHTMFQFFTDEATLSERIAFLKANHELTPELTASLVNVKEELMAEDDIVNLNAILESFDIPKLRLSCQLYQRSLDTLIGGPFNIASYSLLTEMYAHVVGMIPGEFIWTTGDTHVYKSQMDALVENPDKPGEMIKVIDLQLSREPRALPRLRINRKVDSIFDFKYEDFDLEGYNPHAVIKYPDPAV